MRIPLVVTIAAVCALAGCAEDLTARFPAAPGASTGTIILVLSQAAEDVTVAVNGVLVVEDAHTKRIVLERVPTGTDEVVLAGNGGDKTMHVWVDGDHPTTIPIGMPDAGAGGFFKSLLGTIVTIVVYSLIHG